MNDCKKEIIKNLKEKLEHYNKQVKYHRDDLNNYEKNVRDIKETLNILEGIE